MVLQVARHVDADAARVWAVLVDSSLWPRWGPSVRRATLDGPALELGCTGRVWAAAGPSLPFVITEYVEGRTWSWSVAGVPATSHRVDDDAEGSTVSFGVPWWAPAYLPVCALALRRFAALV